MVVPEEKATFLISAQFFSLFHSACIHAHMRARTHTHTPYSVALFSKVFKTMAVDGFCSDHGYGFSSGHVWMWELDCEESWAPENWSFWTVVLEKTLESPMDCKEIQPVHSKGDQSWVFIERTDAEAETPILWPPHVKS